MPHGALLDSIGPQPNTSSGDGGAGQLHRALRIPALARRAGAPQAVGADVGEHRPARAGGEQQREDDEDTRHREPSYPARTRRPHERERQRSAGSRARRPRAPKASSAAAPSASAPSNTNVPAKLIAASPPVTSGLSAVPTCTPSASQPKAAPRLSLGTISAPSE